MQLEEYFEFEKLDTKFGEIDRIRFKGSRIALEHVLEPYLQGESAERVYYNYRHVLTLEQVYAAITFYLNRRVEIDAYLERGSKIEDEFYQDYLKKELGEVVKRLRTLATKHAETQAEGS